jgi:serine/threonine protein kinase
MAYQRTQQRKLISNRTKVRNYQVKSLLGFGSFGEVYCLRDINTRKHYAMKIEFYASPFKTLQHELEILRNIHNPCFPTLIESGEARQFKYVIMPVYGRSISDYRKSLFWKRISPKILIPLSIEMFKAIHQFHLLGYVHRDIKGSNFLFKDDPESPVCLIDFGVSRCFIDPSTSLPFPAHKTPHFLGTKHYASHNIHQRNDASPADDLISWLYTIVECWFGHLPWHESQSVDEVGKKKARTSAESLCRGMPMQYAAICTYLMGIRYDEMVDYEWIGLQLADAQESVSKGSEMDWAGFYNSVHADCGRLREGKHKGRVTASA